MLLLDEPEAHLDNDGRARVELLARRFEGAIVAVSHDRYLLDEIVDQIASLDHGQIRLWPGNYSAYTLERELELRRQQQAYVTQQKEIERLEAAIARFKLWASWVPDKRNIRQANNKQRQIDRMDTVDRPVLERRKIALRLRPTTRGGQRVFELRSVGVHVRRRPRAHGRRSRRRPRRADRSRRAQRRRQVGAPEDPGRRDRALVGRGLGGAVDLDRVPGPGAGHARPRLHPARHRPARRAGVRGRRRLAVDEVPVPLRAGAPGEPAALGRRAHTSPAAVADGGAAESARPRRADESPRHRIRRGARERDRGVHRHGRRDLHDRYFLDRVADRIVEVDGSVLTTEGGYSAWLERKAGR